MPLFPVAEFAKILTGLKKLNMLFLGNRQNANRRGAWDTAQMEDALAAAPEVCCSGRAHIFFRGVSDDRLYVARDRHWNEVKYFRPRGLRVFCAHCRRRLL